MSSISPLCLLFTGCFTWILGLGSIGLWVGCYFECPTGRDVEFNYYVAVWTGVVAFLTGMFHMVFCCGRRRQFGKVMLWSAACCSFILLPCALLCTTLSGYLAWREWDTEQRYRKEIEDGGNPEELQGNYVAAIALFATMTVVGALLLILTCIFNCYHCCGNSEVNEEEVEIAIEVTQPTIHEETGHGRKKPRHNTDYYSPPPPEYVRQSNTFRNPEPIHDATYNTTRSRDYYFGPRQRSVEYSHNQPTNYSSYSRSRLGPETGTVATARTGTVATPRTGTVATARTGTVASARTGTVATTRNYNHDRRQYNINSHPNQDPTHVRWEDGGTHRTARENPWTFGAGEHVEPRLHQSNYY